MNNAAVRPVDCQSAWYRQSESDMASRIRMRGEYSVNSGIPRMNPELTWDGSEVLDCREADREVWMAMFETSVPLRKAVMPRLVSPAWPDPATSDASRHRPARHCRADAERKQGYFPRKTGRRLSTNRQSLRGIRDFFKRNNKGKQCFKLLSLVVISFRYEEAG
jgi:hypothetical protein